MCHHPLGLGLKEAKGLADNPGKAGCGPTWDGWERGFWGKATSIKIMRSQRLGQSWLGQDWGMAHVCLETVKNGCPLLKVWLLWYLQELLCSPTVSYCNFWRRAPYSI